MRWRAVFRRAALDRDLDDELSFHLERETEANIAQGMTPEEARRRARIDFDGVQRIREEYRDVRGDSLIESAWQDARFGLRMLRSSPVFTLVAVATLALGLGANTAMFSVINAVLLRPLPFADPDRLVRIIDANPGKGFPRFSASPPNFLDWKQQARSFSGMAALTYGTLALSGDGPAQRLNTLLVTPDFLDVLGVSAAAGRFFTAEDGVTGHDKVAVLSYRLWQQRFGGDRGVIGRTIKLDNESYEVRGVAPADFRLNNCDVVVPLAFGPKVANQRGAHYLGVYARLKPEASLAQANEEIKTIAARLAAAYPDKDAGWTAFVMPLHEFVVGNVRRAMLILFGAVGFLALIACANVANLLLARAVGREREISVRTALGASRGRIVRQLLTESLLLCIFGTALGMALAAACLQLLKKMGPADVPRLATVQLDTTVLAFTAALTLLATLLFGVLPALRASRVDVNVTLKSAGRGAAGSRESARPRDLLVLAELALSVVLLIGAGLLIRSFARLSFTSPGLDTSHVLTFNLSLPAAKYSTRERINGFYDALLEKLRALPGVTDAGSTNVLPLTGDMNSSTFTIRGKPVSAQDEPSAEQRVASRDYFRTMRIPLLRGRLFESTDRVGSAPVLVVSETMARHFWPGGDALGQYIHMGVRPGSSKDDVEGTIVGVVGDVRDFGLDTEPPPTVYTLADTPAPTHMNVVMRTAADPAALAASARAVVASLDADVPVGDVASMDSVLAVSLAQRRFYMLLLSSFAAVAVLLAGIGLYGVIAYSVNQRVQEIGIRMALGATPATVLGMVLKRGLQLSLAGIAAGVLFALAVSRVLSRMLVGVSPKDPLVFGAVAAGIALIAVAACYVPARRATAIDPMSALRSD
jgi:putative ABC transport system permease protein